MPDSTDKRRRTLIQKELAKFPDHSTRALARALAAKYPRHFITQDSARQAVRYERGELSKAHHRYASMPRANKPAPGGQPNIPRSHAEEWLPFVLKGEMRVGFMSDLHLPYHDVRAIEAAVADLAKQKLDTLVLNGDVLDFFQISRFDKGPGRPTVKEELRCAREFFEFARHKFKKARIIYKLGNHEERWEKYICERAPEIFDLTHRTWEEEAGIPDHGIEMVRDKRIIMVGKLAVLHGHELPAGGGVNPARGAFLRTMDSVAISHHHRTSEHIETTMMGRTIGAVSFGCLCDRSPDYARINKWNHGYGFGEFEKNGNYHLRNRKIIDGKVY